MFTTFDTETTGLIDKKLPLHHEFQPHICQIAAIETDGHGRTMNEINFLIKPSGWSIPAAATAIHGISQTAVEEYGVKIEGAMHILRRMFARSLFVVAHNIEFDMMMLRRETGFLGEDVWIGFKDKMFCTMEVSRDILKLPPTPRMAACGITEFKNPNLQEAHRHFFSRDFDNAHDAMADVRACRDIFIAIQNSRMEPPEEVYA